MTTQAQRYAEAVADQTEAQLLSSNITPGMKVGEELASPNGEITGEVTDILHKNLVSMWNRETGAHSFALPYMVPDLARQRLKSGTYQGASTFVFRLSDLPAEVRNRPVGVKLPCYLNETHPDAGKYHAMGFARCLAKSIPSQAALESHMAHSHKQAWSTIQKELEDTRRDEDREFSRSNTLALQALVTRLSGGQPVLPAEVVSPEGQAAVVEVAEEAASDAFTETCDKCGVVIGASGLLAAHNKMAAHKRKEHGPIA
jgi:hypothetical protein